MKLINREMKSEITGSNKLNFRCQASLNSDGRITLRKYTKDYLNSDEIIILSEEETDAIIQLFGKMLKVKNKLDPLPF